MTLGKTLRLAMVLSAGAMFASPASAQIRELTPLDYVDIQRLAAKYAYAIDRCTNRGYDYADLYVADGVFSTSRNGRRARDR